MCLKHPGHPCQAGAAEDDAGVEAPSAVSVAAVGKACWTWLSRSAEATDRTADPRWALTSRSMPFTIRWAKSQVHNCAGAHFPPEVSACSWSPEHLRFWKGCKSVACEATSSVGFFTSLPHAARCFVIHWSNTTSTTRGSLRTSGHGGSRYSSEGYGCSLRKCRSALSCSSATSPQKRPWGAACS